MHGKHFHHGTFRATLYRDSRLLRVGQDRVLCVKPRIKPHQLVWPIMQVPPPPTSSPPPLSGPVTSAVSPPPTSSPWSKWWVWAIVVVVILAVVGVHQAQTSSQPTTSPPQEVTYTVAGYSTTVDSGCTPGTSSSSITVSLISPTSFPARTSPTSPGADAEFGVEFGLENPTSSSQTLSCIWTYSPFQGDYTSGGTEEYFGLYYPSSGLPLTIPSGSGQEVIFYVSVPAGANDQVVQLAFGLSS